MKLKQTIRKIKKDESGISTMLGFILVVFPLIVIIFAILEIAYMGSAVISMNRGLMESLTRTATSPAPMAIPDKNYSDPIKTRWKDNLVIYLLSQGTSRTQFYPNSSSLRIVKKLPEDSAVDSQIVYAEILVSLNKSLVKTEEISALEAENISVIDINSNEPPMITIKIKYRYEFIGAYLSYLLAPVEKINSIVLETGMTTVNEHPNYFLEEE